MSAERIGNFELREKLGEGGMGQVYLASDTRLGRDVALKLLPDSFANDPARMARFRREARLLASLNHPNIAAIYGVEESEGKQALVMELVRGEDLRARIARGALALDETLELAVQIATALEAAHHKGVVHRDLKPANVMLTAEGQVKVLDFGLAKSVEAGPEVGADSSRSPTLTLHETRQGLILGTAAYMSPEQARGRAVDARSDIFSLGCVLFEMLAGERAYGGENLPEILASVIEGDARWERLPSSVPETVRKLLARCLERRVDQRYQAIGDVRIDLATLLADPALLSPTTAASDAAAGAVSRGTTVILVAAALLAGAAAAWVLRPEAPAPKPLVKFRLAAPDARGVSISPDGRWIAWVRSGELWLQRKDQLQPRRIDLPWNLMRMWGGPGWSRDSKTVVIANGVQNSLWRVPVDGGEPKRITEIPGTGFLWGVTATDDDILFGMASGGLQQVPLQGGEPRVVLEAPKDEILVDPHVLPNGHDILFCEGHRGRIAAFDGETTKVVLEIEGARFFSPAYSPAGYLLVRRDDGEQGIWAAPFSLERLATTGPLFQILPWGSFSLAGDDTLVFRESIGTANPARLVWTDRQGLIVGTIGEAMPSMHSPSLSPDERLAAVSAIDDDGMRMRRPADVYVFDLRTGARYPLRDDSGKDVYPFWRAGGKTIGYVTYAAGVRRVRERAMDGTGEVADLGRALWAGASRDGRYLLASYPGDGLRWSDEGSNVKHPPLEDNYDQAALAPAADYLAYTLGSEPGLFIRRFPSGTGMLAVTSGEVSTPRWSADGKELFFWQDDSLAAVPIVAEGDGLKPGAVQILFSATNRKLIAEEYDVAKDGRFLMLQSTAKPHTDGENPGIVVILNWAEEYRRK